MRSFSQHMSAFGLESTPNAEEALAAAARPDPIQGQGSLQHQAPPPQQRWPLTAVHPTAADHQGALSTDAAPAPAQTHGQAQAQARPVRSLMRSFSNHMSAFGLTSTPNAEEALAAAARPDP